jgi:pimeloyl-ACP methyl ester carboxylesterase
MEDKLISPRNLERWKEILTSSKEIRLENVGHFIADEAPVELTNLLRDFLSQVTKDK